MKDRKKVIITIIVIAIMMIMMGTTYAIFNYNRSETIVFKTGKLEFALLDGESVRMENAYPVEEAKGMESEPYRFRVKNSSREDIKMYYSLSLLADNKKEEEKYFRNEQIRVNVKNKTTGTYPVGTEKTGVLLSEINGFNEGEAIGEGKITMNLEIEGQEEYEYELRLWIDENVDYTRGYDENGYTYGEYNNYKYVMKVKINAKDIKEEIGKPVIEEMRSEENRKRVSVTYQETSEEEAEYYLMSDIGAKINSEVEECGSGDYPIECRETKEKEIKASTWYRVKGISAVLDYDKKGTIYAMSKVGEEYTEKVRYEIRDIDNEGPVCEISNVTYIGKGKRKTVVVSCRDESEIEKQELRRDSIEINENIKIIGISEGREIEKGYEYEIEIEGVQRGTSQIKIKDNAIRDKYGNYSVEEIGNIINITDIEGSIEDIEIDLSESETKQINVENERVRYEIEDTTIATVSEGGVVRGVKPGVTKVKIIELDGNVEKEINVVITKTIEVRYRKEEGIVRIGKERDTCVITNGEVCSITLPSIEVDEPTYIGLGWYKGEEKITTSTIEVRENIEVIAKAKQNTYEVTYNYSYNGGERASKTVERVVVGELIDLNATAEKEGYTFVGWNTNKDATSKLSSLRMSEEDITLYAIYKKEAKTYTASLSRGSGIESIGSTSASCSIEEVYNNEIQGTSCNITLPSMTADVNSTKVGWYNEANNKVGEDNSSLVLTSDINLTAEGITKPDIQLKSEEKENGYEWAKSKTYTITYTNNNIIGTKHYYQIDNGDQIEVTGTSVDVKVTSNVIIRAFTKDNLNNSRDTSYTVTTTDGMSPNIPTSTTRINNSTGQIIENTSNWSTTNLWWGEFRANDNGLSGINRYEFSTCDGIVHGTLGSSYTYGDGENSTYCIRSVDNAGNASEWSSPYYFKINIPKTIAVLLPGNGSTSKFGDLAGSISNIRAIRMADSVPNGVTTQVISTNDSESEAVAWYDNGTIYIYSSGRITLNSIGNGMFSGFSNLADISGLNSWNTSNVTNMTGMFAGCASLVDLTPLANWDTSNVTDFWAMFSKCTSLTTLNGLQNWNTSNVTGMYATFADCTNLIDLSALSNWNVLKVTNMGDMFYKVSAIKPSWYHE